MEKKRTTWHGAHHYSKKIHWFFIFFLFLAIATIIWAYFSLNTADFKPRPFPSPSASPTQSVKPSQASTEEPGMVFCTQDAKQCPNGTWVGRSGPNCEFVCP